MSGQDWLDKDFYAVLGVSKDATRRRSRRPIARRPAVPPRPPPRRPQGGGDVQGDRRGLLGAQRPRAARAVRRDPRHGLRRRTLLRRPGRPRGRRLRGHLLLHVRRRPRRPPRPPAAARNPDLDDLLKMFGGQGGGFGGGTGRLPARPLQGPDISARTRISFRDAALGTEIRLTVDGKRHRPHPRGRPRRAEDPPARQGPPGPGGAGDLLLTLDVEEHPVWSADGANLRSPCRSPSTRPCSAPLSVPLLDGGPSP